MKKTGFKQKQRTPLKRTPLRRVSPNKAPKKRSKLPTVKSVRNKCDALLTPLVKALHPNCLLCAQPTQVAHHHIKKSTSSSLRYYLPNLIPLCNFCHLRLHNDEILWCGRVIKIMGLEWLEDLEEVKRIGVKTDVHFYLDNLARLQLLLQEANCG